MALILCPKNTEKVIQTFSNVFRLRKVPKSDCKFWHGNFKEFFYEGLDGKVNVLFTGYSGAVVGQAIFEYDNQYRSNNKKPEIYFVGSTYAFRDSKLEPGDLVYAIDSFSPDSFEQAIYENARIKHIRDVGTPDPLLLKRILKISKSEKISLKPSKVYCRISPGIYPKFQKATELMNEAMWWKLSLSSLDENGFDSGEYESASVLATSKLLDLPAVVLLDVKDKRYSPTEYKIASDKQKKEALNSILNLIKKSILR